MLALCSSATAKSERAASCLHEVGDESARLSPDGAKVALTRIVWGCDGDWKSIDIRLIDLASGRSSELTPGYYSAWAPDSARLATVACGTACDKNAPLAIASPGTTGATLVPSATVKLSLGEDPIIDWSALDRIAYVAPGASAKQRVLYSIAPDGSGQLELARSSSYFEQVEWSPAGDRIAYLLQDSKGDHALTVINADGSGRQTITEIEPREFWWSPDGESIVISGDEDTFRLDVASGGLSTISAKYEGEPSPDGRNFASYQYDIKSWAYPVLDLNVADTSGGRTTRLTRGAQLLDPQWLPDGRSLIAYGSRDCLSEGVYLIDVASKRVHRLSNRCRQISGKARADNLLGSRSPEEIDGGSGNDLIRAGGGSDSVRGGRGNDVIHGGTGMNLLVGGPGHDKIYAEGFNDFVDARDGKRDLVFCRPEDKTAPAYVRADRVDKLSGRCKRVSEKQTIPTSFDPA